jgi:hypothetical protein
MRGEVTAVGAHTPLGSTTTFKGAKADFATDEAEVLGRAASIPVRLRSIFEV